MAKARLIETTNPNMKRFVGMDGNLRRGGDGKFYFQFVLNGEQLTMSSRIVGQLGDMNHPTSKEVCFKTSNSYYTFEKLENVCESLYSWVK